MMSIEEWDKVLIGTPWRIAYDAVIEGVIEHLSNLPPNTEISTGTLAEALYPSQRMRGDTGLLARKRIFTALARAEPLKAYYRLGDAIVSNFGSRRPKIWKAIIPAPPKTCRHCGAIDP